MPITAQPEAHRQSGGDDNVDSRAGERHDKFLHRFLGNALQSRQSADGQKRDVYRFDAVTPRRQHVTEFMQQHAEEDAGEKQYSGQGRIDTAPSQSVRHANETEQQQERKVDANIHAQHPPEAERPGIAICVFDFHKRLRMGG